METTMTAMKISGRRPLLATAAVLALATAAWLGAPLAADASDKVAAAGHAGQQVFNRVPNVLENLRPLAIVFE